VVLHGVTSSGLNTGIYIPDYDSTGHKYCILNVSAKQVCIMCHRILLKIAEYTLEYYRVPVSVDKYDLTAKQGLQKGTELADNSTCRICPSYGNVLFLERGL
jgi:hypothetical protein